MLREELLLGIHNVKKKKGSAKRWSPGCVNAACKVRQEWQVRAVTKFTKPGDCLLADPCIWTDMDLLLIKLEKFYLFIACWKNTLRSISNLKI